MDNGQIVEQGSFGVQPGAVLFFQKADHLVDGTIDKVIELRPFQFESSLEIFGLCEQQTRQGCPHDYA